VPHMYCRCLARAGSGRLLVSASATFCGPAHFNNLTWPSRTISRKLCTRVSTCRVRSRLAGFSLIIIQEALSSHISVAPTCRKLKPRSNARKWTASWTACDAATNSVSALLRVTPPCRELRHETAPSLSLKRYLVIDLRVSGCAAKSLSTQPVSLLRRSSPGSQYVMPSL
jgi:hypothetical protein